MRLGIHDPYNDFKITHLATLMNYRGRASALCYKSPREIPASQDYIFAPENYSAVTCPSCLGLMGFPDGRSEAIRRRVAQAYQQTPREDQSQVSRNREGEPHAR